MKLTKRLGETAVSVLAALSLFFTVLPRISFNAAGTEIEGHTSLEEYLSEIGDYDEWDGNTATDWASIEGKGYVLENAADFAGFVNQLSSDSLDGAEIKLDANVDISAGSVTAGNFAGTLDLNGHAVKTASGLFDTNSGVIKNGIFVGSGSAPVTLITANTGAVEDITFMSDGESSGTVVLCKDNNGTIERVTGVYGMKATLTLTETNSNGADITDCSVAFVSEAGGGYRGSSYIVNNNGDIENFTVQSKAGEADAQTNYLWYNFYVINNNNGTIDGLVVRGIYWFGNNGSAIIKVNNKTIKNADVDMTLRQADNTNSSQTAGFISGNSGIISESIFNIDTESFASSCFVENQNSFSVKTGSQNNDHNGYSADVELTSQEELPTENNFDKDYAYQNCEFYINYLDSGTPKNQNAAMFAGNSMVGCTIKMTGVENAIKGSNSTTVFFATYLVDCTVDIDYIKNRGTSNIGDVFNAPVINCDIKIGTLQGSRTGSNVSSSPFISLADTDVVIDNVIDLRTDYGFAYGLIKDSNIVIKSATGNLTEYKGCRMLNSSVSVTYSGEFDIYNSQNNGCITNSPKTIQDCDFYYFFDDNATGTFTSLFDQKDWEGNASFGTASGNNHYFVSDTLVYIDSMPNGVTLRSPALISGAYTDNLKNYNNPYFTKGVGYGIVLIAPKVNVNAGNFALNGGFSVFAGAVADDTPQTRFPTHSYFDVNLYFKDSSNSAIKYVSATRPSYMSGNEGLENVFNINVYNEGGSDLDMPVYAYMGALPTPITVKSTLLRSNTTSPKSALYAFDINGNTGMLQPWFLGGYSYIHLENCAMYLPNANSDDEYAGLIQLVNYFSPTAVADIEFYQTLCGVFQSLGKFDVKDCYVPEGQSTAYRRFSGSDPKLHSYTVIEEVLKSNISSMLQSALQGASFGEEDDITDPDSFYALSADEDGALAYLLDKGGTSDRTVNWTVGDDTCYIVDPRDESSRLWTFPSNTLIRAFSDYTIENRLNEDINLNPVYKATSAVPEVGGYILLEGLASSETDPNEEESSIYAKSEAYIVKEEHANDGYVYMYATEQFGNGTPTEIPMKARAANYTISGYQQPADDVIITPVFDKGYVITDNLTGETDHGSVTPSVRTALAGTEITVSVSVDSGYELVDLKWNENEFSTPYTGLKFTMPAQDVEITGEIKAILYNINCKTEGKGTLSASHSSAAAGEIITVDPIPSDGYKLVSLKADGVELGDMRTFNMPAHDVEVVAVFEEVAQSPLNYKVICKTQGEGTLSASHTLAPAGEKITVNPIPLDGYKLVSLTLNGVELGDERTFIMPAQDVEVKAVFEKQIILTDDPIDKPDDPTDDPIDEPDDDPAEPPADEKVPYTGVTGIGLGAAVVIAALVAFKPRKNRSK